MEILIYLLIVIDSLFKGRDITLLAMISFPIIILIRFYQLFFSPILKSNCRYLPTCSEYFIDCLKIYGPFKGFYFGTKRVLSCHPIKILGGGEGFDPVIKETKIKK